MNPRWSQDQGFLSPAYTSPAQSFLNLRILESNNLIRQKLTSIQCIDLHRRKGVDTNDYPCLPHDGTPTRSPFYPRPQLLGVVGIPDGFPSVDIYQVVSLKRAPLDAKSTQLLIPLFSFSRSDLEVPTAFSLQRRDGI